MLKRSAIFDIVFWEGELVVVSRGFFTDPVRSDTRHLTLKGGTDFVVSSRSLARALLFNHLAEHASDMGLDVYAFSSLADPAWIAYQQRTKVRYQTRMRI
jgi:hypothetical protein